MCCLYEGACFLKKFPDLRQALNDGISIYTVGSKKLEFGRRVLLAGFSYFFDLELEAGHVQLSGIDCAYRHIYMCMYIYIYTYESCACVYIRIDSHFRLASIRIYACICI